MATLHKVTESKNGSEGDAVAESAVHKQDVFARAVKDFDRSVEITRDVWFQANLRLSKRNRASTYIIAVLSLYVIALSLLPNIVELKAHQNQILIACSIVLSVFIIFTSLIDGSQNFYHRGELLHQCARKIATVHHELKLIDPTDPEAKSKFERLMANYKEALDDCPVNHDNVDYFKEMAVDLPWANSSISD